MGRAAADHGDVWVVHDGLTNRDELGVDVLGPHIAVMGSCHLAGRPAPAHGRLCSASLAASRASGRALVRTRKTGERTYPALPGPPLAPRTP